MYSSIQVKPILTSEKRKPGAFQNPILQLLSNAFPPATYVPRPLFNNVLFVCLLIHLSVF